MMTWALSLVPVMAMSVRSLPYLLCRLRTGHVVLSTLGGRSPSAKSRARWVQLHAEQPHPSSRLSSHSHWVQLHAEQPHPGGAIASSDTPPVSSLLSLSLLCGLAPASLSPLFPTPSSAPFSAVYCGFFPAATALDDSSTRRLILISLHSSRRPQALRSQSYTVASSPRPSR